MRDVIIRAAKTFVQAAIGCVIVAVGAGIDISDKSAITGLLVSAVSAGASAAWNIVGNAIKGGEVADVE